MTGVITQGGKILPCPSCGGTHRIAEILRWTGTERTVERDCVRCRKVEEK